MRRWVKLQITNYQIPNPQVEAQDMLKKLSRRTTQNIAERKEEELSHYRLQIPILPLVDAQEEMLKVFPQNSLNYAEREKINYHITRLQIARSTQVDEYLSRGNIALK